MPQEALGTEAVGRIGGHFGLASWTTLHSHHGRFLPHYAIYSLCSDGNRRPGYNGLTLFSRKRRKKVAEFVLDLLGRRHGLGNLGPQQLSVSPRAGGGPSP